MNKTIYHKMKEDFLHYLWRYKKFNSNKLKTTGNEELLITRIGDYNQSTSGPDFFNTHIIINKQKWAGNLEIHKKSSDWYLHHHEKDSAYDNVILHVVWEDDVDVFRKDNSKIPVLQLKDYIDDQLLVNYEKLFQFDNAKKMPCQSSISSVSDFTINHWKERLYIERLESKSLQIERMLDEEKNDWESILFKLLAKNFGLTVNSDAFLSLSNSFDFTIVRKCRHNLLALEALFFGQSNLLDISQVDGYVMQLNHEYLFLKNKFGLDNQGVMPFHFFRLRPSNFPTIRIAQFASLYYQTQSLFSKLMSANTIDEMYAVFDVSTTSYWDTHYTFVKQSSFRKKKLTNSFVNLIVMNTILPLKFLYHKTRNFDDMDNLIDTMYGLPPEKNTIVNDFKKIGIKVDNGLSSQAMIQLKNVYCDQKKCLKCAIGNYLLNQKCKLV